MAHLPAAPLPLWRRRQCREQEMPAMQLDGKEKVLQSFGQGMDGTTPVASLPAFLGSPIGGCDPPREQRRRSTISKVRPTE